MRANAPQKSRGGLKFLWESQVLPYCAQEFPKCDGEESAVAVRKSCAGVINERSAVCQSDVKVSVLCSVLFYHCSVVVCGRKIAIGDVPPVAQLFPCIMGTAAPVGHSWFVQNILASRPPTAQENERERQPARKKCAEDARVAPARKMLSSARKPRKAPSSLVSAQDIAPSFSLATGGDSCEHRALAGRWRKRWSGRPCSMRPAGRARSLARLAGRLAAAEPMILAHAALEHTF